MKKKHVIRENFRNAVFGRDNNKCAVCGREDNLDAHHIISRDIMPNGGYVKENGISLCEECHIKAETMYSDPDGEHFDYAKEKLFEIIGSNEELAYEKSKEL